MSKVKELSTFLSENGNLATLNLLSYPVYISEKLSSCNFYVQRGEGEILFFKGDGKKQINAVDRTLNKLYESGIEYVLSNGEIYSALPENWKFAFDYFPTRKPAQIEYDRKPDSGLILNRIMVLNESGKTSKIIDDPQILKEWSSKFGTDSTNALFTGRIERKKAESIVESLNLPTSIAIEQLFKAFGVKPQLNESFNSEIDSVLLRVYKRQGKKPELYKITSEHIEYIRESKQYVSHDTTSLLVLDFLDYVTSRSLKAETLISKSPDERYVEIMSSLFEGYLKKYSRSIDEMSFETGEFASDEVFELNSEMIRNPELYSMLQVSEAAKKAFQIVLNSFRTTKNQSNNPLFSESLLKSFNETVDRIKQITEAVPDKDFMTFGDYMKLKELNESIYSVEKEAPREEVKPKVNAIIPKEELLSESISEEEPLFCETVKEESEEYIKKQESE